MGVFRARKDGTGMRLRNLLVPLAIVLALSACLSTALSPIGSSQQFTPEEDEKQLWQALRQAEEKVLPPKAIYDDPPLDQYLTSITQRVIPAGYARAGGQPIQVKVRKDPRLNAGAMPHGLIIVHTGLVSRAESEGELAGILAHEVAHITHRHGIRTRRELQNQQTAVNIASFLGTLALATVAVEQNSRGNHGTAQAISAVGQPLLALGLNLTYSAMVSGFSRDMEREADEEGVRNMAAAGYSPRDLAQMFRRMVAESPDRGAIETFFWGSHPRLAERIETVEQAAMKYAARSDSDKREFEQRTARVRLSNARWDAYLGRWQVATRQVDRVMALALLTRPTTFEDVWRAHLHGDASVGARSRKDDRSADREFVMAVDRYHRVTSASDTTYRAGAYRGLGELYFAHRDHKKTHCEAKSAFTRYLELQPDAKDTSDIKSKLSQVRC
jgi:predicted Zn-dependent protease